MSGGFSGISSGSAVTWTRPGNRSYPVRGIVEGFIGAHAADGPVLTAAVRVTADAGLYSIGDVITVPVAELEASR